MPFASAVAGTVPTSVTVLVEPSDHVGWFNVSPVKAKKATINMLIIDT